MAVDQVGAMHADPAQKHRALVLWQQPAAPRAAVLVLHGGRAEGRQTSRPWHTPGLRMRPLGGAAARRMPAEDLLVGRVRYRFRGWNGADADPLRDARQALDELQALSGEVPVVLLGHSMGGRAALHAAGHPAVVGVVALAPWCPPEDPVIQLRGRTTVILHGERDRVTDPALSRALAYRARAEGARAGVLLLRESDHAMLRRWRLWHELAAETAVGLLTAGSLPVEVDQALGRDTPVLL
ncbi:alpha/beta fold hydrolase [Streptomyces physcomitrii]|uniref:alpha/beta hydrolase n=1 Tax=Streptomyces physcomitrii TaxID=2724184 RepID=UPI0034309CDE